MFEGYENIDRVKIYKTCSKCNLPFRISHDGLPATFACFKHRPISGKCIDCGITEPFHVFCYHKKYGWGDWIKSFFCT